jgi:hypothetical protein
MYLFPLSDPIQLRYQKPSFIQDEVKVTKEEDTNTDYQDHETVSQARADPIVRFHRVKPNSKRFHPQSSNFAGTDDTPCAPNDVCEAVSLSQRKKRSGKTSNLFVL